MSKEWENSVTSSNSIDILWITHHLMSDKINVLLDNEIRLPQASAKQFPPFVGSSETSTIIEHINLYNNIIGHRSGARYLQLHPNLDHDYGSGSELGVIRKY